MYKCLCMYCLEVMNRMNDRKLRVSIHILLMSWVWCTAGTSVRNCNKKLNINLTRIIQCILKDIYIDNEEVAEAFELLTPEIISSMFSAGIQRFMLGVVI